MGDPRRHELFADFIARNVTDRRARIADVATGKGALSFALLRRGFSSVTPFEPEPRRGGQVSRLGMRVERFTADCARDFDVVVGMHPDGATDEALAGAAEHDRIAIVCPCCVRPSRWPYRGSLGFDPTAHERWRDHLRRSSTDRGATVWESTLPMRGANHVLVAAKQRDSRAAAGMREER